jgi:hypothetical protein
MEHFRHAGKALLKAKKQCKHGTWLKWLEKYIRCNERQGRRYMALAKSDAASDLEAQWRIIPGHADSELAADDEPVETVETALHRRRPCRRGPTPGRSRSRRAGACLQAGSSGT